MTVRADLAPVIIENKTDEKIHNAFEELFLNYNKAIADWFDRTAEHIDLFFIEKKLTEKQNPSKIRIDNIASSSEGQTVTNKARISAVLRLINVEEYWQLKFSTYDENSESRNSKAIYLQKTERNDNLGASVSLFRKLGDVNVSFQPRVSIQNPLKVSHSIIFESTANMPSYKINPKLELYAKGDTGAGVYWVLNFNFVLNDYLNLVLINNGDYISTLHLEIVTNGFSIEQILNDQMSLTYGSLFFSTNQVLYHLDSYSFFTTWSHVLYKNILSYKITPHLDFNTNGNYTGRAGLALGINLDF